MSVIGTEPFATVVPVYGGAEIVVQCGVQRWARDELVEQFLGYLVPAASG